MSTAVSRTYTQQIASQSTQCAPVLEFRCLYTHDLKRKQKRWQDGRCKYHTFNKRVMLYDGTQNFLGDAHWQESHQLQDGDEIMLERAGLLVQVEDQIASTVTNLAPLLDREQRERAREERNPGLAYSHRVAISPQSMTPARSSESMVVAHQKHRSLNALLGQRKGPLGKAVAPRSPFDERHSREGPRREMGPPAKRQKLNPKDTSEWGNTTFSRPSMPSPLAARSVDLPDSPRTSKNSSKAINSNLRPRPALHEVIDLISDSPQRDDGSQSPVTCPESEGGICRSPLPVNQVSRMKGRKTGNNSANNQRHCALKGQNVEYGMGDHPERSLNKVMPHEPVIAAEKTARPIKLARAAPRAMLVCQQPLWSHQEAVDAVPNQNGAARGKVRQRPRNSDLRKTVSPVPSDGSARVVQTGERHRKAGRTNSSAVSDRPNAIESSPAFSDLATVRLQPQQACLDPVQERNHTKSRVGAVMITPAVDANQGVIPTKNLATRKSHQDTSEDSAITAQAPDGSHEAGSDKACSPRPLRPSINATCRPVKVQTRSFRRIVSEADADLSFLSTNAFDLETLDESSESNALSVNQATKARLPRGRRQVEIHTTNQQRKSAVLQRSNSDISPAKTVRPPTRRGAPPRTDFSRDRIVTAQALKLSTRKTKETDAGEVEAQEVVPRETNESESTKEKELQKGPWTIEATDLFDWRPPDWEERRKRLHL